MESNREFNISKVSESNAVKQPAVGSSFIKDGFEIHIESVYIVNGKKKRKVKKKRITTGEQSISNSVIESELAAIKKLSENIVPKLVIPKNKVILQPSSSQPNLQTNKQTG